MTKTFGNFQDCLRGQARTGSQKVFFHALKFLPFLCLPLFAISCASNPPTDEDPSSQKPADQPEPLPELPPVKPDDGLDFVDPDTTAELMKEGEKKTVIGPLPITPPAAPADSTIEIKPPAPADE